MSAVVLSVVLVLVKNRNNQATVWFIREHKNINVVWLLAVSGIASVLAAWLLRGVFRVTMELRRIRVEGESARILREQERRSRELAEQEKRIDMKLKASLEGHDESSPEKG
jgi:uncharacterized membrane protein YciS (DUF1049 family)